MISKTDKLLIQATLKPFETRYHCSECNDVCYVEFLEEADLLPIPCLNWWCQGRMSVGIISNYLEEISNLYKGVRNEKNSFNLR